MFLQIQNCGDGGNRGQLTSIFFVRFSCGGKLSLQEQYRFPIFSEQSSSKIRENLFDSRTRGKQLPRSSLQRKTKTAPNGAVRFGCGDGGNRTRVQTMFSYDSTKGSLFWDLRSRVGNKQKSLIPDSLCFGRAPENSQFLVRKYYTPFFLSDFRR